MNFSTAEKVNAVLDASQQVEYIRSQNRAKVQNLFNGVPPLSADQAAKMNLRVNCNWMQGPVLAQAARRQYYNAFLRNNHYFKVSIPSAPPDKKMDWELTITNAINRPLKQSLEFYELYRSKFASVVAHGVGPQVWYDRDGWLPKFVPMDDLRIPTDTETSGENLVWFGVKKRYTPGELAKKVFGPNAQQGWKKDVCSKILDSYKDINNQIPNDTWATNPERMWELLKQDMGFYMSDAVPTIPVWHFYYLDDSDKRNQKWKLKVVPAEFGLQGLEKNTFLYDSDRVFADDLSELLHIQYGDLNGKPPFMYNSVRSLGFLLMEPCYWNNLLLCRFLQHVWENFNLLLRGGDPSDRARSQKVELFDKAWLPNDVQIVPREQRHQIDSNNVEFAMAQMRQLMGEASSAYTQDIDDGTSKERTKFEVSVMLSQVNSMMAGLLNTAFQYEIFAYREICRRFCNRKSLNKDVAKFLKICKEAGIPRQYLNVDLWDVTPDAPLGSGNQSLEIAQASELMNQRGAYGGEAQAEILHMYTAAITGNPKLANALAPIGQQQKITNAQTYAEFAFGTMMQGVPVRINPDLNPIDQIETLLGLMSGVIARIEKQEGMATSGEVAGLYMVGTYIGQLLQQLQQDPLPANQARAKQYAQDLGELMNLVKAFAQRLAEQQGASQDNSKTYVDYKSAPRAVQAQIEAREGFVPPTDVESQLDQKTQKAQHSMALKEAQFQQKQKHTDDAFIAEQNRQDSCTAAELHREGVKAGQEIAHANAKEEKQEAVGVE